MGLYLIYPEHMGTGTGIESVNGLTSLLYHIYLFLLMAAYHYLGFVNEGDVETLL